MIYAMGAESCPKFQRMKLQVEETSIALGGKFSVEFIYKGTIIRSSAIIN
jgi:hypothetical protein